MNHFPPKEVSEDPYMVVIRGEEQTLKGYADRSQWPTDADGVHTQGLNSIRLTHLQSGTVEDVPLDNVKSLLKKRPQAQFC